MAMLLRDCANSKTNIHSKERNSKSSNYHSIVPVSLFVCLFVSFCASHAAKPFETHQKNSKGVQILFSTIVLGPVLVCLCVCLGTKLSSVLSNGQRSPWSHQQVVQLLSIAVRSWICLSPTCRPVVRLTLTQHYWAKTCSTKLLSWILNFVKRSKTTNLHDRRWFSLHKTRLTGKHSLHDEETFILAHEEKKAKIKTQLLPKTTICKCVRLSLLVFFTDCKNLGVHLRHPLCQPIDFQAVREV